MHHIVISTEDVNELTHIGQILRRRDGNYIYSCNHCGDYFDVIAEIIDHMNKEFEDHAKTTLQSKLDLLSYTEFVDVSMPTDVKFEVIEDYGTEENGDENLDDNIGTSEELCVREKYLDKSTMPIKRKLTSVNYGWVEECVPKRSRKENQKLARTTSYSENISSNKSTNNSKVEEKRDVQTNLIKCCWCSESFNDFGEVQNHLTDEHNKKPSDVYSCDRCQLFFKNLKLVSEHILSEHGHDEHEQFRTMIDYEENAKPIQCIVCNLWTTGTKAFNGHIKQAHKMYRILQCYVCGIFKKKPSGLLDHLKVHDRFRKYRCYECDNVEPKITNPNDLRSHKCILCGTWFMNHSSIRNHLTDVHGQDQIYDCTICDDFTFKTEWDLKMHGINVHEIPSQYKCEICDKHCKSIQSLNEHRKSHSTTYQLNVCSICGSKFRRKDYLARHIKSHSDANKDFKCYICKKEFQSNGYLKNHIKRHTEKKQHQCDVCGFRFLLAGLLRKHMKEHEGEIWKCTQCSKEFSNKSKLTAHEKTHVTERNYGCDICLKTYKTSKNLRQHKLVHSVERRIKCRICKMTFNQGQEHELHLQTHNSDVTC